MGGIVGAGLAYSQYIHAIDIFEGGRHVRTQATAGLFSSFAVSAYSPVSIVDFGRNDCAANQYI